MKKKFIYLSLLLGFSSCDKFLDKDPDLRTDIGTVDKVSDLLTSAYSTASYYNMAESRSDNVVSNREIEYFVPVNTTGFTWSDLDDSSQDSPNFFWSQTYKAIAAANHALREINQAKNPSIYSAQKGEALVCRAYAHFMLAQFFANFYDKSTADTDPGIPYVTEPETTVFKEYERNTVAYTYEMIEKDLRDGLTLINDDAYEKPKFHFNTKAANAFAARFYLFKKDYDKAIFHTSNIIPTTNVATVLRDLKTKYYPLGSDAYGALYTNSAESTNLLLREQMSWYQRHVRQQHYSVNAELRANIFDKAVIPRPTAYKTWIASVYIHYTRKFNENWVSNSVNSTDGRGWLVAPLFTMEEVLLNRAEAYASKLQFDKALADINAFIQTRVLDASYNQNFVVNEARLKSYFYNRQPEDAITDTEVKEALIKTCLQLRRMEFLSEGLRWFDILRHKLPVEHTTASGRKITLSPNSPLRTIQIPENAISTGIEPNVK